MGDIMKLDVWLRYEVVRAKFSITVFLANTQSASVTVVKVCERKL